MAEILLTLSEIKNLIPHREPMLLLDQVSILSESEALGQYLVRGDEFFLQGHYPGDPLVPGHLQSEMLAQLGAVLICHTSSFSSHRFHALRAGKKPVLAALSNVRFKSSARPGDLLSLRILLVRDTGLVAYVEGSVLVGDRSLMTAEMTVALI